MATKIIDYSFSDVANVSNQDGSYKAVVEDCALVAGPGATPMGNYTKAFRFTNGFVKCDVTDPLINFARFTVKLMMKVNAKVTSRQDLAVSTHLPFLVFLEKDPDGGDLILQASVGTRSHDWSGVSTRFRKQMQKDRWYEVCMAYDTNTLGLFLDGVLNGIWAFPDGTIEKKSGKVMVIGAWVDTVKYPFSGDIAAFQWMADIPPDYELPIDSARDDVPWHMAFKYESVKSKHYLGTETKGLRYDAVSSCHLQEYQNGWMMFNSTMGAFEIHGAILDSYKALSDAIRKELSWLVSDEINGKVSQSKKSLFKGGAIYWSSWTPATAVIGQMYLDYETLGEGRSPVGLPLQLPSGITGGTFQKFQMGGMFCKTGAQKAYEVHDAIFNRYEQLGQYGSFLGWPISNESEVRKNNTVAGKYSDFEGGTIFWKSGIGAFEIHGDIGLKYREYGGPAGPLGFPKSNESDIPNHTGPGKYNVFEGGIIVWYGSLGQTYICPPFKIQFERIETTDQDPWPKGENDIYMHLYVYRNGSEVFHVRKPNSGDYGDHNTRVINYEIPGSFFPDSPGTSFSFRCKAKDADYPDDDETLGDISTNLDIHNAWGQRNNNGIFVKQAIKHMKITWSVKPQFDINQYTERQWRFWGVANRGTDKLTWAQYAAAFSDVTGNPDVFDHILSPLDYAFFKWVFEGIARKGNCFGMSLEAINAWKHSSIFNCPLNRYTWEQIRNEVNIKHAYQVGANAIWWFVGQFLTGNTHDPKDVFTRGRSHASSGDRPIYCITQDYEFSGKPHAILPWKWDRPNPWQVEIFDPNNATEINTLIVNSSANTFSYNNDNSYSGGAWIGGRFHYMPWSVVNSQQRTPIWDAILLLLTGTVIILADSAETTSLTNLNGGNIDGGKLKADDSPRSGFFVPFHAFNGHVGGEFFLRKGGGIGASFRHLIRGKNTGRFEYALKNLSTGIHIESSIHANETHDLSIKEIGLPSGSLNLNTNVEKSFKIQYVNYLGNIYDRITMVMEDIHNTSGQELRMVPKPGLAGFEIEGMKEAVKPKIVVEIRMDGKVTRQSFNIDSSKAIRMDFSRLLFSQELKVLEMDRIGGIIKSIRTYKPF